MKHNVYFRLKEASLSILEKYGSQLIKIIKFRDSFVMIGQKGLARGKAIETVGFNHWMSQRFRVRGIQI